MGINSDSDSGGPDGGQTTESVETLVSAGRYADAAARARTRGDFARAAELYERIWQFAQAAACAREAGDLGQALRHAIDARDDVLISDIAQALDAQGDEGRRTAMETFARRRRFEDAASRAEALGELDKAIEYYRTAHRELDAARLLETAGRDREAGRLLERFVTLAAPGAEQAEAHLRLGRLLYRRMQYPVAVRHLQEAARHDSARTSAQRLLIVTLSAMGLRDAARDVLVSARTTAPDWPADLEAFLRAEREAEAEQTSAGAETGAETGAERDPTQVIGGRYRLDALLGAGGTGRVYRAHDEVTERAVAVKVFSLSRGHQSYERFVREARVAGALRHPNLVEVHDFSADQGYLVMEYLEGGSLAQRLEQLADTCADGARDAAPESLPQAAVRRLALDVLAGLELAHQRGIIHRDVKPANIFFDRRGTAKLGDFGVAHLLDLGQTQTGGLIGTLAYMAPEQITGAPLTIAADLYALGISLYEALTGRLPFLGPDFVAQHLGETPPRPSALADIVLGWDDMLTRMLAKNPAERHGSVDELRRQLMALDLGEQPTPLVLPRPPVPGTETSTGPLPEDAATEAPDPTQARATGDESATPETRASTDDDSKTRYRFETTIGTTAISHLSRALDTVLNRSVIIERYREGGMDEFTEQRLYALARGGSPFLQWALAYDRDAGIAVFEAPSGVPLSEIITDRPLAPRPAVRLLMRLARAVALLHSRGVAHGALNANTVVLDEHNLPTVLLSGLGPATQDQARPRHDVDAILGLVATAANLADKATEPDGTAPDRVTAAALVRTLSPKLAPQELASVMKLAAPQDGEELYTFSRTLDIALLRSQYRG